MGRLVPDCLLFQLRSVGWGFATFVHCVVRPNITPVLQIWRDD